MEDAPLDVFVSYARNDDLQAIPGKGIGFVSTLIAHVEHQFRLLGPPVPQLFRDTREIWESDQFEEILGPRLAHADVLLVVFSNNWLHREWCLRELALFAESHTAAGPSEVRRNIIVVSKNRVPRDQRPELLQGQQGYDFFRLDNEPGRPGEEYPFFWHGEPRDEFHDVVERVARDLRRRALARTNPPPPRPGGPSRGLANRRKIYVAKPAGDMQLHYRQVVDELERRGFEVVPPAGAEIPTETATTYVATHLAMAEASIHLLGEGVGDRPDDSPLALVALQLKLAAQRTAATPGDGAFRRIIWAPKALIGEDATEPAVERDPLEVLARFDRPIESDTVLGSEITRFVEFVIQTLARVPEPADARAKPVENAATVYVYHRSDDREYGRRLARALKAMKFNPVLPVFEGDLVQAEHMQVLQDCDAVVLGWVNADDSWVKARTREWRDWQSLGRDRQFEFRGLIAGPPKRDGKADLLEFPPAEVDIVLDLTAKDADVTPDELRPLVTGDTSADDA